jgi:protein-disulfide isomerase
MRHLTKLILVFCVLVLPASALATVDFIKSPPLDLKQPVKAMTPSFDGTSFFVLGQNSVLYIYNDKGEKQGETKVDSSMDMISVSGFKKANIPEFIFLSSSTTGAIQKIAFDKIATFNLTGSPFIGNKDAKVAVVIFSDFQ